MMENRFIEEEIILCTYIALYGLNDFTIENVYGLFGERRTIESYSMKIMNIVSLFDAEGIVRSASFGALSGHKKGAPVRRTNWDWIEPLVSLKQEILLGKCYEIFEKYGSENKSMLIDLGILAGQLTERYQNFHPTSEVILPEKFKSRYRELLEGTTTKISFSTYTSVITTYENLIIACPNQWFYIASFFAPFVTALETYREHFYEIFKDIPSKEQKEKILDFRDNKRILLEDFKKIRTYFKDDNDIENFTLFLCNYEWWYGSRTIDRGDYYQSTVLKLAKVVNVSQGYIAEIAYLFAKNSELSDLLSDVEIITADKKQMFKLNDESKGLLKFKYKNILLKGVPGTGKSHLIDKIITDKLVLRKNDHNVLRINIHSASSNADLMQGIGIGTHEKQIVYQEKQGLILNHIRKAIASPLQPFVIVLEEIQENSLNELIGDLIYLIEDSKRAAIDAKELGEFEDIEGFVEHFIERNPGTYYVEIPYLVSTETRYKKMILPDNLYIFCTSNYRDDKKVIEDNLLRRFEVIEVYPAYKETIGKMFKSKAVSDFLKKLNSEIVKHFQNAGEIHPDRFMIGHAIWLDVENEQDFYAKLLKVTTEFKDIRELDYESDLKPILMAIDSYPFGIDKSEFKLHNYKELIDYLQNKCYRDLFGPDEGEPVEAIEEKELVEDSGGAIKLSGDGEEEPVEPTKEEELAENNTEAVPQTDSLF